MSMQTPSLVEHKAKEVKLEWTAKNQTSGPKEKEGRAVDVDIKDEKVKQPPKISTLQAVLAEAKGLSMSCRYG